MLLKTRRARLIAVASAMTAAAALTTGLMATSAAAAAHHRDDRSEVRLDRVFIIVLENHSAQSVIGDPNTHTSLRSLTNTARPLTTTG